MSPYYLTAEESCRPGSNTSVADTRGRSWEAQAPPNIRVPIANAQVEADSGRWWVGLEPPSPPLPPK